MGNTVTFYNCILIHKTHFTALPMYYKPLALLGVFCDLAWSNGKTIKIIREPYLHLSPGESVQYPRTEILIRIVVLGNLILLGPLGWAVIACTFAAKVAYRKYIDSKYIYLISNDLATSNSNTDDLATSNSDASSSSITSSSVNNQTSVDSSQLIQLLNETIKWHVEKLSKVRNSGEAVISIHLREEQEKIEDSKVGIDIKVVNKLSGPPEVFLLSACIGQPIQSTHFAIDEASIALFVQGIPIDFVSKCKYMESASIRSGTVMSIQERSLLLTRGFEVYRKKSNDKDSFEATTTIRDDFSYFSKESALSNLLNHRHIWDPAHIV